MLDQLILRSTTSTCGYQLNPEITDEAVTSACWIFKLFLRFPRMRNSRALESYGFDTDAVDRLIAEDKPLILSELLHEAEQRMRQSISASVFERNFSEFCALLSLKPIEQKMFRFALVSNYCSFMFEHVHAPFYLGRSAEIYTQVGCCIDVHPDALENLFAGDSSLKSCNLVKKVRGPNLAEQFSHPGIFDNLFSDRCEMASMLAIFSQPAMASNLTPVDFKHIDPEFRLVDNLLKRAIKSRQVGCNFLIFGPPGTGKTEFARLVSAMNGANVQEISAIRNEENLGSKDRLHSYQICQRIYANNPETVIIFDEADDVIPSALGVQLGNVDQQKQALHKILESNSVPCLWLCNSVANIDPAMLRRFTQILMLDVPPTSMRLTMAKRIFNGVQLAEGWLERLCLDQRVTPAILERLRSNSCGLTTDNAGENTQLFEMMLNPLLIAMDGNELRPLPLKTAISIDSYNADHHLDELLKGLRQTTDVKICLYGPPGTGKSSFAALIASLLNMPLLKIQASDLLGSYVGETEKAIAKSFRQARQQNAVLLFDEVDTFLLSRDGAEKHWHKTMVNEFLSQLDEFSGLFVCTTNFIELLDKAALRRFDFKIKLNYLSEEQCAAQLSALISEFGIEHAQSDFALDLQRLTPADFVLARRKLKLLTSAAIDMDTVIQYLLDEQAHKTGDSLELVLH
jgi:SpoVK/Ycf46/Vps4 family AAA+-type ATPase